MKTLLIVSLKGGTGKSTIAAMLAVYNSMTRDTILIDADIDSPNLAEIIKVEQPIRIEPDRIDVAHLDNLDFFSMGLIAKDKAISMKGDAYVQILLDILQYANWRVDLKKSLMLIDCPAGASDLFKGVLRAYYETIVGALIVITPSAHNDLKRIVKILQHYGVPVVGVVENMAYFKCEHGTEYRFFGNNNIKRICSEFNIEYFGEIPLSKSIADVIEAGIPFIPDEVEPILQKIIAKVNTMKPASRSILSKITSKITDKMKKGMVKVITNTIIKLNKYGSLKRLSASGFGGNIIEFIVLSKGDIVTQVYLKLRDGKLLVVKEPKVVNLTIMTEVDTLFKIAKGDLDLETAFFMGEIEVFGSTGTTRALSFFQKLWDEMKYEMLEVLPDEIT